MAFDSVIVNPGRLRILTALAVDDAQEFVRLRATTRLTDGNLSAHARRLQYAGFILIDKSFQHGRPVTSFRLTSAGRAALERHASELLAAIGRHPAAATAVVGAATPDGDARDDDWVD